MALMVLDDVTDAADGGPVLPDLPPLPQLPGRLAAEAPGWVNEVDVVVVGSGIAGLTAALECRELGTVLVVTKDVVASGSTNWAQGGIASVQAEGDTVEQHVDRHPGRRRRAVHRGGGPGAGLRGSRRGREAHRPRCGVRPRRQRGELELTREGGHHRNRIAHAGGDATGAEIERALIAAVTADRGIEIVEQALVLDLIPAEVGRGEPPAVAGVTLHVLGEGTRERRRGGARPGGHPGDRRDRSDLRRHDQPAGLHR